MTIAVQVAPTAKLAEAHYRWDADTDILTVSLALPSGRGGASGSVELQGADGSWLTLDVVEGRIGGFQVAVWPRVTKRAALAPPEEAEAVSAALAGATVGDVLALEVTTRVAAEADAGEHLFHFCFGPRRPARAVRIARDVLLELDERRRIAGLWLLNVPPFPDHASPGSVS